jgi:type IV pilus assembly protein PilM
VARRVIGLDVGSNAVTVAEVLLGSPPKLTAFGQVALARSAMREGEIADEEAVVDAIKRLRNEVGLRKAPVRVGMSSPRLIVRQVEMPVMSRDDLAGALRFQAQDLIPIPLDEAVLDFAILDTYQPVNPAGEPTDADPVMRVLLAAAQKQSVARLVEAVERAGMPVESVDLVPLALIRSLANLADDSGGSEGIVSIGGGVTCVVVHERGTPRFVRVLATGGRALSDAIAQSLELPPETAESLKRQIGSIDDDIVNQARAAIERPLGILLDEIRSSLDYYRNQPGASRLQRVQLTGGGAQLASITERLGTLVGVPVELAQPRTLIEVGEIGFGPDELPRLDPYLPAAVGLALGDATGLAAMNLLPRTGGSGGATNARPKIIAGAAVAAAIVVLAVPVIGRKHDASNENKKAANVEAENTTLQSQIAQLSTASNEQRQVQTLRSEVTGILAVDVSWSRMLNELARTMPNNVWLTSFQGQVSNAAPATGAGATPGLLTTGALSGTVNFGAMGLDFPSVADWLKRVSSMASFSNLWVPQAQSTQLSGQNVVSFNSTANVTPKARSNRADAYTQGAAK